ncbi:MAG: hypothetical protein ACYC2W_10660 [Desulfurivibrionaceae bacterium]
MICHAATVSGLALVLHYVWENVQCRFFFIHRVNLAEPWSMLQAAGGDVILTWIAHLVVTAAFTGRWLWLHGRWTRRVWVALLGTALVLSITIETYALATEQWAYTAINPRLPLFEVSLLPGAADVAALSSYFLLGPGPEMDVK